MPFQLLRCAAVAALSAACVGLIVAGEWGGTRLMAERGATPAAALAGSVAGTVAGAIAAVALLRLAEPAILARITLAHLWLMATALRDDRGPVGGDQIRAAAAAVLARAGGGAEARAVHRMVRAATGDLTGLVQGLAMALPSGGRRETAASRLWLRLIAAEAARLAMARALAGPEAAAGEDLRSATRTAVVLTAQVARPLVGAMATPVALGWALSAAAAAVAAVALAGAGVAVAVVAGWALRRGLVEPAVAALLLPRQAALLAGEGPHRDWAARLRTSSPAFRALSEPPGTRPGPAVRRSGRSAW